MLNRYRLLQMLVVSSAFIVSACQSNNAATFSALEDAGDETMAEVKSVLARAMNTASVEIGPGDLTETSTISVLPPPLNPYEDRSTVKPTLFDIMIKGSRCYVVRRDTGDEYELAGVSCRALDG